MKLPPLLLLVVTVVLPLGAAACTGDEDSGSRAEEISKALRADDVPEAVADCLGAAFAEAGLTRAETDLDDIDSLSVATRKVVNDALASCAGADVVLPG